MSIKLDTPKVFISYSWSPFINKQKTLELAERLQNDGVHVVLDVWDLAEGHDKYHFMEQMVNDPDIKRVLIICNEDYTKKANSKKGGVGVESIIVSDEVYSQVEQTKFIPIIFERDELGKEYVPTFIKSRMYIDLCDDDTFENEYERLLRNIYDKPTNKRPPIGSSPAYIHELEPTFLRTAHKVKAIENALKNEKKNSQAFIDDYYKTFLKALDDFRITNEELKSDDFIDELVLVKVESIKALRNDFVDFLEVTLLYSTEFDEDKFHTFLESLLAYLTLSENVTLSNNTKGYLRMDVFKFFFYELFLYLTQILIEKEKFSILGNLLKNSLLVFDEQRIDTSTYSFTAFCQHVDSLNEHRNKRLNTRRISIVADMIKQRADLPDFSFNRLAQADVLLYYCAIMRPTEDLKGLVWDRWWPYLTAYHQYRIPILGRLKSKRFFEKFKPVFGVDSIQELNEKVADVVSSKSDFVSRFEYDFPKIQRAINPEEVGVIN